MILEKPLPSVRAYITIYKLSQVRANKHITKAVAIQTGRTAKEVIRNDGWNRLGLEMNSTGNEREKGAHTRDHVEAGKY